MATSNAFSTDNDYIKYKITISQKYRLFEENASNVTVSVFVYRTNTGYTTYGTGKIWYKIDGVKYYKEITSSQKITNSGITILSVNLDIPHNVDGSKKLTVSAWFEHSRFTSKEQSYTQELVAVPRATTPTLSSNSIVMGESVEIRMPRASDSFKHYLYYSWGNESKISIAGGLDKSYTWVIPYDFAYDIPNATKGSGKIHCETWNGNTFIGSKEITFEATVPESFVPTLSMQLNDEQGYLDRYGKYIQNLSKLNMSVDADGVYDSSITSYKTEFCGKTYTSAEASGDVTEYGTLDVKCIVTDSRGRYSETIQTIDVYEYEFPQITKIVAKRCSSTGQSNSTGEYIGVTFSSKVTSLDEKNTVNYLVKYKKTNDVDYTIAECPDYENIYEMTDKMFVIPADKNSSYEIILVIQDDFKEITKSVIGSSVKKFWSWYKKGLGLALNKIAELEGVFDIGFKTKFSGGILQEVLEKGSNFNEVVLCNTYAGLDASDSEYVNCPISNGTFILEVLSMGNTGDLLQRVTKFTEGIEEVWQRVFLNGEWGLWDGGTKADFVVEQGKDGKWNYQKWASGQAECWMDEDITSSPNIAWGSAYYAKHSTYSFPTGLFLDPPQIWIQSSEKTGGVWATYASPTKDETGFIYSISPVAYNNLTVKIHIKATGAWK